MVARITGVLVEVKMDRDGQYTLKFECPHSEKENIKILEDMTQKAIILNVKTEEDENIKTTF